MIEKNTQETVKITPSREGGTPLWVQARHDGHGVKVSQGTSYLSLTFDESRQLAKVLLDADTERRDA